jgi:hypothetical protein
MHLFLGPVDKCAYPNPDSGDLDEGEIAHCGFIVAGRQPSRVLEFVEATFDAVAQGIDVAIDRDLNLAVPACRNDRRRALFLQRFANMIRIIAAIGKQDFGLRPFRFHQGLKARIIRDLACGNLGGYRQSFAVRAEVNLCREATS